MNKKETFIGTFRGYPIYLSNVGFKKYYAIVNGRKIHFGDRRYQHFKDKMMYYSYLNHYDRKRRNAYKKRHENNRHDVESAGWFADKILW